MSIYSELTDLFEGLGINVETGVFSDIAPNEYVVITPMSDIFELFADNLPGYETQEARISVYSKGNYHIFNKKIIAALFAADYTVTERRYIGHEDDTKYHHYAIDVAKLYETEVSLWQP